MTAFQQTHILIVDDTPQHIIALEAVLSDLGQHLIFASSAKEALRQLLLYDFAVILLDVHMPIMNGFEVARLIRARKKSSYTPIIFLTAINKDDENINEGYAMGAVDYVFKPINPVILRTKVKVFVDLYTKSSLAINLQNELKKRKQAEKQALKQTRQLALTETNRLITMEEITSALAHEINQPLTVINTYVQGCIHRLKSKDFQTEKLIEVLQHTSKQAERAGEILHRIKSFIRKNNLIYETVEINQLISSIEPLLHEAAQDAGIKINIKSKDKIPNLILDKIQFEQVLLNILQNSIDALKNHSNNKKEIIIETYIKSEQTLIIIVRDNGPGIPSENLLKVFDLYFTTKKKGMGVGLSICRTIVETHGGSIIAQNNPKGGACFQISLPLIAHNTALMKA